jgi:hypothetical protein
MVSCYVADTGEHRRDQNAQDQDMIDHPQAQHAIQAQDQSDNPIVIGRPFNFNLCFMNYLTHHDHEIVNHPGEYTEPNPYTCPGFLEHAEFESDIHDAIENFQDQGQQQVQEQEPNELSQPDSDIEPEYTDIAHYEATIVHVPQDEQALNESLIPARTLYGLVDWNTRGESLLSIPRALIKQ